jgi:hypothetical protein
MPPTSWLTRKSSVPIFKALRPSNGLFEGGRRSGLVSVLDPVRIDPAKSFAQGRRIHGSSVCKNLVL